MAVKVWHVLILSVLLLAACGRGGERSRQAPDETSNPTSNTDAQVAESTSTEASAEAVVETTNSGRNTESTEKAEPTSTPESGPIQAGPGTPPQTNGAEIRPPEMRMELSLLSNLLGYQILDSNGVDLGVAADYVINTCETYIVYISMDPEEGDNDQDGMRTMLPFELVTLNSGVLDAAEDVVGLYLPVEPFQLAPMVPDTMDLTPTSWEAEVREYWDQFAFLSDMTTECMATDPDSGELVPVYKTAYASELLGAELQDGLEEDLGTIAEAILEPESGKLMYYVVELPADQGLTLAPLGATNIPKKVLDSGSEIRLVLLSENAKLFNAPRFDSLEEATSDGAMDAAYDYW